jgi:hypothetical protein
MDAKDSDIIKGIGSKTGSEMWQHIDDLIIRWARRNPQAANLNRLYNQDVRDNLKDKVYAKSTSMADGRLALSIHPELVNYLEAFYPKLFDSKENVRKFARTYKMFAIAEKQ